MSVDLSALSHIQGISVVDTEKESERDRGRFLLYGPPGSGKSYLSSMVAAFGPTLYLDLVGEKGTRSFQGAPWAKNITVVRPDSVTAMDDLFWMLKRGEHPFKAVVVDSATSMQKMTMRYLTKANETAVREIQLEAAPASMQTWGRALDVMTDLGTFWFGLADGDGVAPMHVVIVAQQKVVENEFTGETTRTIDVQKGAINGIISNADFVIYTDVEPNDAAVGENDPPMRHIALFGSHPGYVTKARVPVHLRGKFPPVLGRSGALSLSNLSRQLELGGVPALKKKPAASPDNTKEN